MSLKVPSLKVPSMMCLCDCIWNQPLLCTSYLGAPTPTHSLLVLCSSLFLSSQPWWVSMKIQWVNRSSPGQLQLSALARCPSCECSTHTHSTMCVNWQPQTRRHLTLVHSTHSPLLYIRIGPTAYVHTYVRMWRVDHRLYTCCVTNVTVSPIYVAVRSWQASGLVDCVGPKLPSRCVVTSVSACTLA